MTSLHKFFFILLYVLIQLTSIPCNAQEHEKAQFWIQIDQDSPHIIKQKQLEKMLQINRMDSILIPLLIDSLKTSISIRYGEVTPVAGNFVNKFQTLSFTRTTGEMIELKIPVKKVQSPNIFILFVYNWEIRFVEPGVDLILPTAESVITIPGKKASISQQGNFIILNLYTQTVLHYGAFSGKIEILPEKRDTVLNKLIHQIIKDIVIGGPLNSLIMKDSAIFHGR